MKYRILGLLACMGVAGAVACSESPTSAGNGEPEAIVSTLSQATRTAGTKFSITAYAIDKNGQRMTGKLDATSAGAAVVVDSVVYVPELTESRIFVNGAAKTAATNITVFGHGLTKDITIIIN